MKGLWASVVEHLRILRFQDICCKRLWLCLKAEVPDGARRVCYEAEGCNMGLGFRV